MKYIGLYKDVCDRGVWDLGTQIEKTPTRRITWKRVSNMKRTMSMYIKRDLQKLSGFDSN